MAGRSSREEGESSGSRTALLHPSGPDRRLESTTSLLSEVSSMCSKVKTREAKDLSSLLKNPHMEALVTAYDNLVAQKYSSSGSKTSSQHFEMDVMNGNHNIANYLLDERDVDNFLGGGGVDTHGVPSNALRVIGMRKKLGEPLGMTVKDENGRVIIARIIAGSLVDTQGLLHVGDQIVEVNGIEIKTPEQFIEEVKRSDDGVSFKVIPSFNQNPQTMPCYLRALFSYDPSVDTLLPCKELGVPFITGEVLEILNREDPNWWQARRLIEPDCPVGLIPSQELEEMRRAYVLPEFDYSTKITICGTKVTKKKKKEMYQLNQYQEFEKAELTLYEEVCRMPPFDRKTLVLIGAQGVGRRTLKARLISYDPDRFDSPFPHTSRPIRENEIDGKQYHFVKREVMEQDIANNKYLECGELQGHLYGTKMDSIRQIIRSGKMCVIDCNPQCLKLLKTKEFMPFVVFIAAPAIEQLRYMHEWGRSHGFQNRTYTFDRAMGRNSRRGRTLQSLASFYEDEDLQQTIEESARLFRQFEKEFDLVLVNNNFEKTFEQLREAVDALSTEPQWVPINWVYSE